LAAALTVAGSVNALAFNTTGNYNTAAGFNAVFHNTTGNDNTGVGYFALFSNTTGLNNIGIGNNAGYAVTGSNNIDIGSMGSAGESGVIRIGGHSQSAAYIAGISSTQLTGSAVYVTANGQLGVLASSERYKTEIASMGPSTQKLHELRPVSFHLKSDPKGAVQYGLIAEEVNKVFPELVIRDEAGTIQGVRYDELAPMLLNEMQEQQQKIAVQDQRAATQSLEISQLKAQLAEMHAALLTLQSKDQLVAQR
jgi:Chaperone of endosialidase